MQRKFTVMLFVALCAFAAQGQSFSNKVVAGSGGFLSNSTGSLSYTIGETMVTTLKKDSNMLTQGFQQGKGQSGTSVLRLNSGNSLIQMFPNPASSFIEIRLTDLEASRVSICILNATGAKVSGIEFLEFDGQLHYHRQDVSMLADGIYTAYIEVTDAAGKTRIHNNAFVINN